MPDDLPFLVRLNDLLTRAWARGWWSEPSLESAALEAEACRRERVDSIPGQRWREPFRLLLADLEEHAALSPLGRQIANGQIVGLLRARIRAERLLRERPEILERPVRAPVVVFGPMRSGTTRMQRLVACDPRFAHTRLFESLEPVPYGRGPDRRRLQAAAVQTFLQRANPALTAIHPTGPLQPEEEFGLHSFSFHGAQFEVQWNVPSYAAYIEQTDPGPAYREFRILLQIMGWSRGEDPRKPWLLKSPQFTAEPEALLDAFPDARLICLNRDWAEVVGSSASLVWHQRRVHSTEADKQAIGAEWLGRTKQRTDRSADFRAANSHVPQLDISYEETNADWVGTIEPIYRFLGMKLSAHVRARMQRFAERPSSHNHHEYSLAEFGLDPAEVRRAFAAHPAVTSRPAQPEPR